MATKLILSLQHREAVLLWGVDFVVAKPGGSVIEAKLILSSQNRGQCCRSEVDFVIAMLPVFADL